MYHIREDIINYYIAGYNSFDPDKMIAHFDDNIIFENVQNGQVNITLNGIRAFKEQAGQSREYFSSREQTIKSFKHSHNKTEVEIDYVAVLAMDFPNGLKKGELLTLKGKSIFEFQDNKIIKLTDIS